MIAYVIKMSQQYKCIIPGRGRCKNKTLQPFIDNYLSHFTTVRLRNYDAIVNKKQKKMFIDQVIDDMTTEKTTTREMYVPIYKLEKDEEFPVELEPSDAAKIVTTRFQNLIFKMRKENQSGSQQTVTEANTTSTATLTYKDVSSLKSLLSKNVRRGSDQFWKYFYRNDHKGGRVLKYFTNYSVLQSISEGFVFSIYNSSHKVPSGGTIHRGSKVILKLPMGFPVMILFHGRLVHHGAHSRTISDYTFSPSRDVRMFAYITKRQVPKNQSISSTTRSTEQKLDPVSPDSKVDTDSFHICQPTCEVCNHESSPFPSSESIQIDLLDIIKQKYIEAHKEDVTKGPIIFTTEELHNNLIGFKPGDYLLGNLEDYGWAAYVGVNVLKSSMFLDMAKEVMGLLKDKGKWDGIQQQRRKIDISGPGVTDPIMCPAINNGFDRILATLKSKFDNRDECNPKTYHVEMGKRMLLANFDDNYVLANQEPHRDYISVNVSELVSKNLIGEDKKDNEEKSEEFSNSEEEDEDNDDGKKSKSDSDLQSLKDTDSSDKSTNNPSKKKKKGNEVIKDIPSSIDTQMEKNLIEHIHDTSRRRSPRHHVSSSTTTISRASMNEQVQNKRKRK